LLGLALAGVVAWGAWRGAALTTSGALAAVVVGTLVTATSWMWCVALLAFFLSSTALSRWRRAFKETTLSPVVASPGPRNARQVFANGGVAALAAMGSLATDAPQWDLIALGSLAAACADTWSTEVGAALGGVPRHVITWRSIPRGTSGGVTLWGSIASLGGAAFVGLLAWPTAAPLAVAVGGAIGAWVDTFLGATLQEERWCPRCQRGTERDLHLCGASTEVFRGVRGFTNDGVNFGCALIGGAASWAAAGFLT
jgi:uncharacterized protein (TIGR00297 family)